MLEKNQVNVLKDHKTVLKAKLVNDFGLLTWIFLFEQLRRDCRTCSSWEKVPVQVSFLALTAFCSEIGLLKLGVKMDLNPIRPGGAQRPGGPNSQLTIRNLLLYDAETWWLLVFILKAHSDQILAKLINQGGCCCSFVIETSQKFWKWKKFPLLENCWNWHGGQFWVEKNDSAHKNSFFFKLNPFSGGK